MDLDKTTKIQIEKEDLDNLYFPAEEILTDRAAKKERTQALHRSASLGNLEKHKVHITFADIEGAKEVFTTIWAVTENKVVLKGGRVIPVNRIISVNFS